MIKLVQKTKTDQPTHWRKQHGRGAFVIPVVYLFGIMTTLGLVMSWQAYQVLKQWNKPRNYFSLEAANQLIDCYVWSLVARITSSGVVMPWPTNRQPSSLNDRRPLRMAASRISPLEQFSKIFC